MKTTNTKYSAKEVSKPLAIDLFCGLGGWTEGLLYEGYRVIGFDIEQHVYGDRKYPAQLVLEDVLTLDGAQFRDAALIVASPPCQKFSYMAMPWSRAKALAAWYRDPEGATERVADLTALFDACFRIQREACETAGRRIPLVVENVMGAQAWVGRAGWHYGSFYLWGDIPALMPQAAGLKVPVFNFHQYEKTGQSGGSFQSAAVEGVKVGGFSWSDYGKADYKAQGFNVTAVQRESGRKLRDADGYERTHPQAFGWKSPRTTSKCSARKAASAAIAKIPLPLARHIARTYFPQPKEKIA